LEFNYDADKNPVILISLNDFKIMAHAALYASTNIEYIKQFHITANQIVEASGRIESTLAFIERFNKEKSPDVPSQVE
jgi:hypothetical protein